jgi:hypothetical protein
MIWFPKKTSHFTQPLDDVAFANLKRVFKQLCVEFIGNFYYLKEDYAGMLVQLLHTAVSTAFTRASIQKSFANVHLFPFDFDAYVLYCKQKLGITAPTAKDAAEWAVNEVSEMSADRQRRARAAVDDAKENSTKVKVYSPLNRAYTARTLVALAEQQEANEAEKKKRKLEDQEQKAAEEEAKRRRTEEKKAASAQRAIDLKCQADDCVRVFESSKKAFVCECGKFHVCFKHNTKAMASPIEAHKALCSACPDPAPMSEIFPPIDADEPMEAPVEKRASKRRAPPRRRATKR